MSGSPRPEDWRVLGVEPGARAAEVRRAYAEKRRLYDGDSLASYMLLEEDERRKLLDRLDAAYAAILQEEPEPGDFAPREVDDAGGPEPSRDTDPAGHLGYRRRRSGMSVERVASETKIRPELIDAIENGRVERLPAAPYVRGFVVQIAELLGVPNPRGLAELYLERLGPKPTAALDGDRLN